MSHTTLAQIRRAEPPGRYVRVLIACCVAAYSASLALNEARVQGAWWVAGDYTWFYRGARAILDGQSPYDVVRPTGPYPFGGNFPYGLMAAITVLPLAWLHPVTGLAVFAAISGGLLAWVSTRNGYERFPLFFSPAYVWCASSGQWSIMLAAAALAPSLTWLATVKPTLGLAALSWRPSRYTVVLNLVALAVCFAVRPRWLAEWISATGAVAAGNYELPLTVAAFGPLVLLALARWRRPEARLLVTMASVPQTFLFYDQVLLWLVPATFSESMLLTALAWGARAVYGTLFAAAVAAPSEQSSALAAELARLMGPLLVATLYLPCTLLVLRRPNVGNVPVWLEGVLHRIRVPGWLAGARGVDARVVTDSVCPNRDEA